MKATARTRGGACRIVASPVQEDTDETVHPGEPPATLDPRHPSSDPDYSRLQSEVGCTAEDHPVTEGSWPQTDSGATGAPDSGRRQKRFDEIDRRAERDAAREVRARETSAQESAGDAVTTTQRGETTWHTSSNKISFP